MAIEAAKATIETSNQSIKQRDKELTSLRSMLAIEDARWQSLSGSTQTRVVAAAPFTIRLAASTAPAAASGSAEPLNALQTFIMGQLGNGELWTSADLTPLVQAHGSLLGDSKSPGRSVHATMIGLLRRGLVESRGDGVWKIKTTDLFTETKTASASKKDANAV